MEETCWTVTKKNGRGSSKTDVEPEEPILVPENPNLQFRSIPAAPEQAENATTTSTYTSTCTSRHPERLTYQQPGIPAQVTTWSRCSVMQQTMNW